MPDNQHIRTGLLSGILAYTIWGFFPIYFKIAHEVGTLEILAHRIIWAVPFGAIIIAFRRQWAEVFSALKQPAILASLALAAFIIALNWGTYIFAVQSDHIFQASLGYYINPLMFVIIGVFVGGEILRRNQIIAVILAAIGVSVLTIYGGSFPWISLILAISFTAYGYLRKRVNVGAMPGLFIETLVLIIPAIGFWIYLSTHGQSTFDLDRPLLVFIILLSGPLTVLPLLFFAIAARKLQLSTLGFLQFIGPSLQFIVGLYYGEVFTLAHAICFGFIWLAVAIFSIDAWRQSRPVKRAA
ncbi:MAG: EamA family transporter RarD [bacterium]